MVDNKAGDNSGILSIMDKNEKIVAEITYDKGQIKEKSKEYCSSYIQLVILEATKIIMEKENIEYEEALEYMIKNSMSIITNIDLDLQMDLYDVCSSSEILNTNNYAVSICSCDGKLRGSVSFDVTDQNINYAVVPRYAASTLKPLSVYGQAIEKDIINYSSSYLDKEVEERMSENGKKYAWPSNTREYTGEYILVPDAVKYSNNAVAVRVLQDLGVKNSLSFLNQKLGFDIGYEKEKLESEGEDSILGNIALGYLVNGVSQLQLLTAYEAFTNQGKIQDVYSVISIQDKKEIYYFHEDRERNIFDAETAYIVNRLLREVVKDDGTGNMANIDNLDICGKTGTSEDYSDNWFIGFTPELLCGVWYSPVYEGAVTKNEAPYIFKIVMNNIEVDYGVKYKKTCNVIEEEYCLKTGLIANENCINKKKGYYKKNNLPDKCSCE